MTTTENIVITMEEKAEATDGRTRMYFRIDPDLRRRFRALAILANEPVERRIERLIREDIERNAAAS